MTQMSEGVTVREYTTADETPVLELLNLTLGTGRAFERSKAFFRWKHFENPFGPSLMLLADRTEIIGLRAFLRWQFHLGETTIQAARAVDTATHSRYQRMGIFSRLTRDCLERAQAEGISMIFNTPNEYSLPGYLKLGWNHVGRTSVMVRPLRPLRLVRALLTSQRGPSSAGGGPADVGPASLEETTDDAGRSVDEFLAADGDVAGLLARDDAALASGIRTARSVVFLRWRYARIPSLHYRAHWVGDRELRAAVIYRLTRRRGLREVTLCELFLRDPRAGRRVVQELLARVQADYAVAHSAWGTLHRRVFLALGFVPAPRLGPHFTVRPLGSERTRLDPRSAAHWRLSLGDLEVF